MRFVALLMALSLLSCGGRQACEQDVSMFELVDRGFVLDHEMSSSELLISGTATTGRGCVIRCERDGLMAHCRAECPVNGCVLTGGYYLARPLCLEGCR